MQNYISLLNNKTGEIDSGELNSVLMEKYEKILKDDIYSNFIVDSGNGGFFYEKSLQIYSFSHKNKFNNIDNVNRILTNEYQDIIDGLVSFGQDIFGNQFCFEISSRKIVFFDSETGERKNLALNFSNWIDVIYSDFDYFIGLNVLKKWSSINALAFNERLYPKIPFIMGGEFAVDNLFAASFPNFIVDYANIAKQVFNLPDGTRIKLIADKK